LLGGEDRNGPRIGGVKSKERKNPNLDLRGSGGANGKKHPEGRESFTGYKLYKQGSRRRTPWPCQLLESLRRIVRKGGRGQRKVKMSNKETAD